MSEKTTKGVSNISIDLLKQAKSVSRPSDAKDYAVINYALEEYVKNNTKIEPVKFDNPA